MHRWNMLRFNVYRFAFALSLSLSRACARAHTHPSSFIILAAHTSEIV